MTVSTYILIAVAVSAVITFLLRALPVMLLRGGKTMPPRLEQLGRMLPSAMMAVLIVYCLRGARSDLLGSGLPGMLAVLTVAGSYRWKHNTFLSMTAGTAVYMILLRLIARI